MKIVKQYLLPITAIAFFTLIATALLAANLGWKLSLLEFKNLLPYGDKVSHFLLMGGLCFFVNLLMNCRQTTIFNYSILAGTLFVIIGVTLEEFSQIFLTRRNFDLLDLAADYLGIFLFSRVAVFLHQKLTPVENVRVQ